MPTVWIQYKSPNPAQIKSYAMTSANDSPNRDPKTWKLQGSNNGTDWTDINSQTNQTFENRYLTKTYLVSTSMAYKYFRLNVTERYSATANVFQLSEWQLFGTEVASTGLNKLSFVAQAYPNPTTKYVIINIEENANICIYDMLGQIKYNGKLNKGTNSIDIANYINAMYIVKVSTDISSESFILRKK